MKRITSLLIISIFIFSLCSTSVHAINSSKITEVEQSQDFKKYTSLSDAEKEKIQVMPETVDISEYDMKISNPIKAYDMVSANSNTQRRYSLLDDIPENVTIKDQLTLGNCWVFSSIASLETNLALANKANNKPTKTYDFSEKHLDYSLTRSYFKNNEINNFGVNRAPGDAGNWQMAMAYLTTGKGAVDESTMPFDDRKEKIDLSELRNATVTSDVQNIKYYPSISNVTPSSIADIKSILKTDIQNNGGISSKVHFPSLDSEYYNTLSGALYCDDSSKIVDHALTIIGWDDDFPVSEFNSSHVPSNPGAWIAKNSWGTEATCTLDEFKETLYSVAKEQFNQQGINSASDISDEMAQSLISQLSDYGVRVEGNIVYYPVGDEGFVYISYEDKKVYQNLMSIVNATEQKNYDNVYYYDEVGWSNAVNFNENHVYLGNIFTKSGTETEKISKVGIATIDETTCKVYINPNGKSMKKSDLQAVELKTGNSVDIDAGYHSLELKNPIEINNNEFAVVVEMTGKNTDTVRIVGESPIENVMYSYVNLESEKCFISLDNDFESNSWMDLSKLSNINSSVKNIDSTLKAYTTVVSSTSEPVLERIEVTTQPYNTEYEVGMNFNPNGMVVTAFYDNNTSRTVDDYTVINGESLELGQQNVTISYNNKTAFVNIKVSKEETSNPIDNTVLPENSTTINETFTENTTTSQSNTISQNTVPSNNNETIPVIVTPPDNTVTQNTTGDTNTTENTINPNVDTNTTHQGNNTDIENDTATEQITNPIDTENDIPHNTNFNNVKGYLVSADILRKTMGIKLTNFYQNKTNDKVEYSYYLSNDSSIPNADFIKIKDPIVSNNTLEFEFNINDVPNFLELGRSDDIYIFIKETASKSGKTSTTTSNAIALEISNEATINDEPVTEYTNLETKPEYLSDNTVAKDPIPQTGMISVSVFIIITLAIGITVFVRYKLIKK